VRTSDVTCAWLHSRSFTESRSPNSTRPIGSLNRRTLERRILAGTAPHMEVLLHHYAFGKPTHKYVAPAPAAPPEDELMSRMTSEEQREMYELLTQIREIQQAAAARSAAPARGQ
jgi:hypothetical protein